MSLNLHAIGGPTVVIDYAGTRFVTDPTFDPPGSYVTGPVTLVKTAGPASPAADLGPVDAVLLSHDHHADNLDRSGREWALRQPMVLTTPVGAGRLGPPAVGVRPYSATLVGGVTVTAVPALHGPAAIGLGGAPVTGFVLRAGGERTTYVSGDNCSVDVVVGIAEQFPDIDVALLFVGAARVPARGDAALTLTAEAAVTAAGPLGPTHVACVHQDGWEHFSQGAPDIERAFAAAGLANLLVPLPPGRSATL